MKSKTNAKNQIKKWLCFLLTICCVLGNLVIFPTKASAASTAVLSAAQSYYITSMKYPGQAINMYVDRSSDIKNNTKVNLYKLDKSQTQLFTFKKNSAGNYLMIPKGTGYTVNIVALKAGTSVIAYQNKAANNEYFIVDKTSDGTYTFRVANAPHLYLTATSKSTLSLKTKASDNSQKFAFQAYPVSGGTAVKPGSGSGAATPSVPAGTGAVKASLSASRDYYITSAAYGSQAVNMSVNKSSQIRNKTKVNLYKLDKSQTQLFRFKKNSAGNYLMMPRGTKYTVNVSALKSNTSVIAYKNRAANNEYFIIEKTADGYYTFRLANAPGLYLTAVSRSKLTLRTKRSGAAQKFRIVEKKSVSSAGNSGGNTSSGSHSNSGGGTSLSARENAFINNKKWKPGAKWGHGKRATLISNDCYGCCAYAMDYVKYVYGFNFYEASKKQKQKYTAISKIAAGDVIYASKGYGDAAGQHWMVVLGRSGRKLDIIEGNVNGKVRRATYVISGGNICKPDGTKYKKFSYGYHFKKK